MRNILIYILLTLLLSCGLNKTEEKELIEFYDSNYEFITNEKNFVRSKMEANLIDGGYFNTNDNKYYKILIELESSYSVTINQIDSCLRNKNYNNTHNILSSYNNILNRIDTAINFDKNYIINRFDYDYSTLNPQLKLLRVKNDLAMALKYYLDFTLNYLNTSCGFYGIGDILATSQSDTNGNTIVTLSSEMRRLPDEGRNLIIEDLVLNNNTRISDFIVVNNNAFSDIKFNNLNNGSYTLKGKIRYYTKKGIKDFPFSHKFVIGE